MENLRFAVIGAGAGGQSMAAILANKEYSVKLHDVDKETIDKLNQIGRIKLTGAMDIEAKPELISTDVKAVVKDTDIIMVVTTTDVHEVVAKAIAPYITEGQSIILNPGHIGGALAFKTMLKNCDCRADVVVAETADLMYACRKVEVGIIFHSGLKKGTEIAAVPARATEKLLEDIKPIFPILIPAENIIRTGMKNSGAMLHSIPMIMNVNRIDSKESFDYYQEGITPSIAKMVEKVDAERIAISKALGLDVPSVGDNIRTTYDLKEEDFCELIHANKAYYGIRSPQSLKHRFLVEDTLSSLVPFASIAKELGVPTPSMDAFIEIISIATGRDFLVEGRTAKKIGIAGKSVEEIYQMVL